MNKRLLRFLQSGCLCLSATIPGAFAQEGQLMTVDLPFEFQVKNERFPAGKYRVTSGSGQTIVRVQSDDHARTLFSHSAGIQRRDAQDAGTLVFKRYGERYFLSQIWLPGSNTGRLLNMSSAEREMARSIVKPATKAVAAIPPVAKR
ncbi:MAG: hypothetical protein ACRD7E_01945 [Bryobacteraceae bacterium]